MMTTEWVRPDTFKPTEDDWFVMVTEEEMFIGWYDNGWSEIKHGIKVDPEWVIQIPAPPKDR